MKDCIPLQPAPADGEYFADLKLSAGAWSIECLRREATYFDVLAWSFWLVLAIISVLVVRRLGEIRLPGLPGTSGREDFGRPDDGK